MLRFTGEPPGGATSRRVRDEWLRQLAHIKRGGNGYGEAAVLEAAVADCFLRRYTATGLTISTAAPDERECQLYAIDEAHRVLVLNGERTAWTYRIEHTKACGRRYIAATDDSTEMHFTDETTAVKMSTMLFDAASRSFDLEVGADMLGNMPAPDQEIVRTRRFITSVPIDDCWFAVAAWKEPGGRWSQTHVVQQRILPAGAEVFARFGRTEAAVDGVRYHVRTLGAQEHLTLPLGSAVQLPFTPAAARRYQDFRPFPLELVPYGTDIVRRHSSPPLAMPAAGAPELTL